MGTFLQFFQFNFQNFDLAANLIFVLSLQLVISQRHVLLCLLVKECDLATCFKQFDLPLVGELFQAGDLCVQTLHCFIFLLADFPQTVLTDLEVFVKLGELQLQQGFSFLQLDELLLVRCLNLLQLHLIDFLFILKSLQECLVLLPQLHGLLCLLLSLPISLFPLILVADLDDVNSVLEGGV